MAYFQMDDGTDTDLRVFKAGTAAFGLYARCGVWVARNLTDGFVPAEIAASYGTREWIDKLVASGLWTLEEGGFGMPDYLGKHENKTAEVVRKRRADAAARQAKMRENRKKRQASNMSQSESRVTHAGTHGGTHASLSDPPPKGGKDGAPPLRGTAASPSSTPTPRDRCGFHLMPLPCHGCAADAKAGTERPPETHISVTDPSRVTRPPAADEGRDSFGARAAADPEKAYRTARDVLATVPEKDREDALATARAEGLTDPRAQWIRAADLLDDLYGHDA